MSTVYLNGSFLPMEAAGISPLDRGFLFGDGIYEVIPTYDRRMVGFARISPACAKAWRPWRSAWTGAMTSGLKSATR